MEDEKDIKQAKTVFDTMCKTLDGHEWVYEKDEEKLCIECNAQGDDLPISIKIEILAGRKLILLLSQLPFIVSEERRIEVATAVSIVNFRIADGSFDYDIRTGHMIFRMTSSFTESLIGNEVFTYMLFCSCQTIDFFDDKLLMLAKGMISLDQFIEAINKTGEKE